MRDYQLRNTFIQVGIWKWVARNSKHSNKMSLDEPESKPRNVWFILMCYLPRNQRGISTLHLPVRWTKPRWGYHMVYYSVIELLRSNGVRKWPWRDERPPWVPLNPSYRSPWYPRPKSDHFHQSDVLTMLHNEVNNSDIHMTFTIPQNDQENWGSPWFEATPSVIIQFVWSTNSLQVQKPIQNSSTENCFAAPETRVFTQWHVELLHDFP